MKTKNLLDPKSWVKVLDIDELGLGDIEGKALDNGLLEGPELFIINKADRANKEALEYGITAEFRHEGNVDGREVYSLELGGRWLHAGEDRRVTLSGPALYKVKGPGGLYANVDGVGDVEIEVGLAAFHNETEVPLKDSSIKYRMTGNTSLIFNRLHNEDAPDKLIYGPAFNQVSFGFGKRE